MTDAREPFVCKLAPGQLRVHPPDCRNIAAVEVAPTDFRLLHPSIEPVRLAAMTPDHFDQEHERCAALGLHAMPVHFVRRDGALSVNPTPDRECWLRVSYRAAIKVETRDPLGQP